MPKNITSEVRDIILKVKEFMDEEKRMQSPIIPLSKVYVRVAAATGQSLGVIKTNRLYLLPTSIYISFPTRKPWRLYHRPYQQIVPGFLYI